MTEWRPETWENPHPQPNGKMHYQPITGLQRLAYENGADAMLAVLREQDIREFSTLVGWVDGNPSGTLVYIPNGE